MTSTSATITWDEVTGKSYTVYVRPLELLGESKTKSVIPSEDYGLYTIEGLLPGRRYQASLVASPEGTASVLITTLKLTPSLSPRISVQSIGSDFAKFSISRGDNPLSNLGDGLGL